MAKIMSRSGHRSGTIVVVVVTVAGWARLKYKARHYESNNIT